MIDKKKHSVGSSWLNQIKKNRCLLLMLFPVLLYFIVFCYIPMFGNIMAFEDYSVGKGFLHSEWVGFRWFREFFSSVYFGRLIKNTLLISIYSLIIGFPIPIIFALLLNEIKDGPFKRVTQTISYLPHFISVVVVVGLLFNFLSPIDGVVNILLKSMGKDAINFMSEPGWFRTLYIGSNIWQNFGWDSIIYLAALSSVDPQLYEAAQIDGAGKFKQMLHVTLPAIMPTIIILLIMNVGNIMNVGFEKIILMYSPATYETADVISTYVYRRGILGSQFSFSASVGLFNSVINFALLYTVNKISNRVSEISLW